MFVLCQPDASGIFEAIIAAFFIDKNIFKINLLPEEMEENEKAWR